MNTVTTSLPTQHVPGSSCSDEGVMDRENDLARWQVLTRPADRGVRDHVAILAWN